MNETNKALLAIAEELKGIREELNYMNGVEVLKDGTKMSRDRWRELTSKPFMKSGAAE